DVNDARRLIDIERAGLRKRNSAGWEGRTVSKSTVGRLLNEGDALGKITVNEINRARSKKSHPLAIVHWHATEKITKPVELESVAFVERTTDGHVRDQKAGIAKHRIGSSVYSTAVSRIISKPKSNVDVAAAPRASRR